MDRIHEAIILATAYHSEQTRASGEPYIFHLFRVAQTVSDTYDSFKNVEVSKEDAIVIALLHDTLEDTDLTQDEIAEFFGVEVADLVDVLSRIEVNGKKESYLEFINQIKQYEVTKLVKLADLRDNLKDCRIYKPGLEKRYEEAIKLLENK